MKKKLLNLCLMALVVSGIESCSSDAQEDIIIQEANKENSALEITTQECRTRLDAYTYGPIGGCTEATISESASHDFQIAFSNGGDFTIRMYVNNSDNEEEWFTLGDQTNVFGTPTITIEDEGELFKKTPLLLTNGEIYGSMRVCKDITACITISAEIVTSTTPLATKTLTRKIYVTQKYNL